MVSRDKDKQAMMAWGRDEMNLVELPFGPITPTACKTLDVVHSVYDQILKRKVTRRTLITGSDAFGLPRPIDDLVLIGMMALTQETGFQSPRVAFSVYQLCRIIGWPIDGRSYNRVEQSISRIAGTTLQFKDAWYDKGEKEFKSKTFHLIDEADLRSRAQIDRARRKHNVEPALSSFVWNQVIWKSFQDGFIRRLDMEMFRKIARGRRRDVPIRLFRLLDKRFHRCSMARFRVEQLAVGILGLGPNYAPSQMRRIINRAGDWLVECGYLANYRYSDSDAIKNGKITFHKRTARKGSQCNRRKRRIVKQRSESEVRGDRRIQDAQWFSQLTEAQWRTIEDQALEASYGTELERKFVLGEKDAGKEIATSGAVRRNYIKQFFESTINVDMDSASPGQSSE